MCFDTVGNFGLKLEYTHLDLSHAVSISGLLAINCFILCFFLSTNCHNIEHYTLAQKSNTQAKIGFIIPVNNIVSNHWCMDQFWMENE